MPKALVLGASGLLGSALMSVLQKRQWQTIPLGRRDGDFSDPHFLENALASHQADAVFNCVAWTAVDDAEDHPREAMELNRALPTNLARILKKIGHGMLVHYSTDFVFSGIPNHPWTEDDPTAPESVYGSTKLAGEKAVREILPKKSCIIRTAWLFGPGRKNFISVILNAGKKRDLLTVVHDQTGSPTYTMDLAAWSAELAEKGATGLWHAVNSGHATWCELAAEAINLTATQCKVEPISSAQWPQKARRPANSILDNTKLANFLGKKPRPWPQALREYLFADHSTEEKSS